MHLTEIDYEERVKMEYLYFEFVNSIRAMSKEIMTHVNPIKNMQKFYQLLEEIRDTLFTDLEFCSRFLKEELRNSDIY